MMSETEEKGNSSSNNNNAGGLTSREECTGSNSEENDTRVLQPFFVADTLEDDESIIPPSQGDSELLIPSTPAYENRSEKRSQNMEANDSTLSILEETCVLEKKTECNDSFGENAITTACNESDMTQDLEELQPTQPIIPSNLQIEHSFTGESNNVNKNKNEEEDDEWQLKFSETQTQDALMNFQKDDQSDEEPETEQILPSKNDDHQDDDDDDLPATLSIEVPPREEENYFKTNEPEVKDNVEVLETQSDDEIEPSQSCLSEYKGETISASFKTASVVETVDETPKLSSDEGVNNEESSKADLAVTVNDENKERTTTSSEKDSKMNDTKDSTDRECHEIQRICAEENKNLGEEKHSVSDAENKRTKNSNKEIETIENNSIVCNKSEEFTPKVGQENNSKIAEISRNEIEEMEIDHDATRIEAENNKTKPIKHLGKKETKSKLLESDTNDSMINSEVQNIEIIREKDKHDEEMCNSVDIVKTKAKNNVEVINVDEEEKNLTVPNTDEVEIIKTSVAKVELAKHDSTNKTEVQDLGAQQGCNTDNMDVPLTEETIKTTEIVPDSIPSEISSGNIQASPKDISDEKVAIPLKFFAKPSAPVRSSLTKNGKFQTQSQGEIPLEKSVEKIASFKNLEELETFLKSMGVKAVDRERLDLLKSDQGVELTVSFKIQNFEVFLRNFSFCRENEHLYQSSSININSSTATSSPLFSKASLQSGEIADISSGVSPGDMFPKTSTQQSPQKISATTEEKVQVLEENLKNVSPVVPFEQSAKTTVKRKRGGKKNTKLPSSDASSSSEPKSKRVKGKVKVAKDETEGTDESGNKIPAEKPKKPNRRKKGATTMPDIKPEEIKSIIESIGKTTEDDSSFQEDGNFGTIIPGCKVMARWKDGFYYSGTVQKLEGDGSYINCTTSSSAKGKRMYQFPKNEERWSITFDDGLNRTISPECLIKIAILPKGTSVLVQTDDGYYDPGIICGHFREEDAVGYEVELDNGVTKRYPRFEVILSNDQAKLVMKQAPPTTPPTMTINLDNIVDGKRKRKSVQSPAPITPPVKKSSRVTRSKKPDPNLDSTAESSAAEVVPDKSKDIEIEETPVKKKKTKGVKHALPPSPPLSIATSNISTMSVGSASTSASVLSISSGSTNVKPSSSKTVKVLPQRTKKLFKDYAFLLTNADRKPVVKTLDTSDSDQTREEEDIVPFDKDDLCNLIASGGGIVLEKFEDIKKCSRKHIYLLANSYLRTMKYIQCIAAGISCIKHHWVQNCIFKSEILSLNSYILPAGYSIVTQQVIEWHGKTDIFKNCQIALVSAPENPFVYTWAPVLLAAKASFVQKWNLPSSVSGCSLVVDVLITNNQCPSDIIQAAKKRKIPIVSSEWIIQCLILGKRIAYDAHPKFRYDYAEP